MYAKAPTTLTQHGHKRAPLRICSPLRRLAKWVMLQTENRIVNELLSTDSMLAAKAAVSGPWDHEEARQQHEERGARGCPTSSL